MASDERGPDLARGPRHRLWPALCLVAGVVSACGFAPLNLWPLTLIGASVLLAGVETAPRLRSVLARGWLFGFGQFVLGLNWIATAFTYQANMPAWIGWVGVVLLSLYLAIFPAVAAGLAWRWWGGDRLRLAILFAAAWIVTEYLRSVLFTGFPWNPLGVALLPTPAALFAALGGTYGLSGLAALIAGALLLLARRDWRRGVGLAGAVAGLALAAHAFTAAPTAGPGALVRIVQPNIPQEVKHGQGYGPQLRRFHEAAMRPHDQPVLMLWPEDAVPYFLDEEPIETYAISRWLQPGDRLLTGGAKIERDPRGWPLGGRNSIWMVDSDGRLGARYDKAHLVPWGEYLPLRDWLTPLGLDRVVPGELDFWEGPGPRTLDVPGFGRVGAQICYEIVFSGQVVDRADRPDFIFNPSNDAWFGWWGPPQHFAQARLRAIEEGLPVIRSTPTGVSGLIDARGRVAAPIPMHEFAVVDTRVPPAAPPTLFARVGNVAPWLFALALVAAATVAARLQSRSKRAREQAT